MASKPIEPVPRILEDLPDAELFGACRKAGVWWQLDLDTQAGLLGTSPSIWSRWVEGEGLDWTPDQRLRALVMLRIFEAVGDLNQEDGDAVAWVHKAIRGKGFGGRSPLEEMASGLEGLQKVEEYLHFILNAWS